MARSEIVALGADNAVGLDTKSLWIVPELWKTQETRFPQARWTRTERAPTRSTGIALFLNEQEKGSEQESVAGPMFMRLF
jgi:hypothetical protein